MKKVLLLISILSWFHNIHATVIVQGNSGKGASTSFTTAINASVFDIAAGIFYVGLAFNSSGGQTIYQASRILPFTSPVFQALSTETGNMAYMSLVAHPNTPAYALIYATSTTPTTTTIASVTDSLSITSTLGANPFYMQHSYSLIASTTTTSGIFGLASSTFFAFAAVAPDITATEGTDFGNPGSGIAVVGINPNTLVLTQAAAIESSPNVQAVELDGTTPQVNIPYEDQNNVVLFPNGNPSNVGLIWDSPLQRLYIPLLDQVSSNTASSTFPGAGIGGRSVVVGRLLDRFGHLAFWAIAPDGAFDPGDLDLIIGLRKSPGVDAQPFISTYNVRVMHCSTGPSYLIVNGNVDDTTADVNEQFYAIPLVDVGDPTNPIQGTAANKLLPLVPTVGGTFQTPALYHNEMTNQDDIAAIVGTGPLPMDGSVAIGDMQVVGDTVYVSLTTTTGTENDTGILYSQAMFDQNGKILSWTPWTRRAFPITAFQLTQNPLGPVSFFSVDAVNSAIWAVSFPDFLTVATTVWSSPISNPILPSFSPVQVLTNVSLPAMLNRTFQGTAGCTSVLDLDQSTPGLADEQLLYPYRYALFGGAGTVVFTVPSQSLNDAEYEVLSPQAVTIDYAFPGYYLATQLPTQCPVTVLEYARQISNINNNYFFAGTQDGLYVFGTPTGTGFNENSLALLNQYPFLSSWIKVSSASILPGAIVDIKTTGLALYVLTYNTSAAAPMSNTLYSIPFTTSIASMFTPSNITTIAQTGVGIFANTLIFSGLQIIMTSTLPNPTTEQIVLATNTGLYNSSRVGGVQNAISQTDADWQPVDSNRSYFNGIAQVDNASRINGGSRPTTVWPFAFASPSTANIFNRSIWEQVSGTTDTGSYNFVPNPFNASSTSDAFAMLPLTTYFWSDGGRRLAVVNPLQVNCSFARKNGVVSSRQRPTQCPAQAIMSLPYNVNATDIDDPNDQILDNHILNQISRFYWIKDIGTTGIILAGTNTGVVALS